MKTFAFPGFFAIFASSKNALLQVFQIILGPILGPSRIAFDRHGTNKQGSRQSVLRFAERASGSVPGVPSQTSRHGLPSRFRLPGIEQVGYAQLSLIETALYPLDRGPKQSTSFSTSYCYTDSAGNRQRAEVKVGSAFEPLKANDDYFLWSLLSLTLRHSESHVLAASPYWLLKRMGLPTGGFQYDQLRQVVERLAQTVYHNTGFYNPLSQEHERWTFGFFSSRLPTALDGDRLWRIVWFEDFIKASRATGGRLLFDLELFRKLGSPATRRLFLKLSDRFYRSSRVHLEVDDLTINGLGLSADRPLKKRKYDLTQCVETLLKHGVITLGTGHSSAKDLFLKREKGRYVVVFFRGPYFEQPLVDAGLQKNPKDDPLYEPMLLLGVDEPMVAKLLRTCQRGMLERWLRITDTAMREKPTGFPGFKVSPAAFFVDGVLNERMPPDWMYQLEKAERQNTHEAEAAKMNVAERLLQGEYERQRRETLKAFLQGKQGRELYERAYEARLAWNQAKGEVPEIARRQSMTEAIEWVDRCDEFAFPEFPVWTLARQATDS